MAHRRSSIVVKALRDASIGLAVYAGLVAVALEDRAQAGNPLPVLPPVDTGAGQPMWSDPSFLTLFVLGLLFATLTAFTLSVWRHFGRNYALTRPRAEQAQIWSASAMRAYRKK